VHEQEPFHGWYRFYDPESDELSPFYGVEHSEFYYDRQVYEYLAHPLWEDFGSDGLLTKVLFANYDSGFAVLEMFGVWNDLIQNDFKLLHENCLSTMMEAGIQRFAFIMENVLNIYLESDDYYEAVSDELDAGWIALVRLRPHVTEELLTLGLDRYCYWSPTLAEIQWRKLTPVQLCSLIESEISRMLPN
jgi:hypothetical protein